MHIPNTSVCQNLARYEVTDPLFDLEDPVTGKGRKMRKPVPKGIWLKVLRESNFMCIYCGCDATEVDHIIPYSYSQNNDEANLVPACSVCNGLASNKIFDSLIEKIGFVQKRRKDKRLPPPETVPLHRELPKLERQPLPLEPMIKYKAEPVYELPPKRPKKKNKSLPTPLKFNNIKAIRVYLKQLSEDHSYENIGLAYGINKAIPWKIINKTYEPKTYEIRLALGLPVRVLVQTVNGYIEPGSISLGSKSCDNCGQPFISNAGKRKLCYLCLKPRDRKAEAEKRKAKEDKNCWFCIECNKKIKGGFPHNGGHLCAGCLIKELEAQK